MEVANHLGQYLLEIAGVFLAVVACAFALIAGAGLLAHARRRKARFESKIPCDKSESTNCKDWEKGLDQ